MTRARQTMATSVAPAMMTGADIVDDAAGSAAHAFESDCHRQPSIHVERNLQDAVHRMIEISADDIRAQIKLIDVAAADVMADFEDHQQHREQNGGGVDRTRRQVVPPAPQHGAREPERRSRNAVTVKQPVEDRRRTQRIADDARIIGDARRHQRRHDGGKRTQPWQRPLFRDPGCRLAPSTQGQQ